MSDGPNGEEVQRLIADAAEALGERENVEGALTSLRRAYELDPGAAARQLAGVMLVHAKQLARRGDQDAARAALAEAVVVDPESARVRTAYGLALLTAADAALDDDGPETADPLIDEAVALTEGGRANLALREGAAAALVRRASRRHAAELPESAVADITLAAELDPDNAIAVTRRGRAHAANAKRALATGEGVEALRLAIIASHSPGDEVATGRLRAVLAAAAADRFAAGDRTGFEAGLAARRKLLSGRPAGGDPPTAVLTPGMNGRILANLQDTGLLDSRTLVVGGRGAIATEQSSPLAPSEHFGLARSLADATLRRLTSKVPGLFDALAACSLLPAYTFKLTLQLALRDLPGLCSFLGDWRVQASRPVLVNSPLHDAERAAAIQRLLPGLPIGDLEARWVVDDPLLALPEGDGGHPPDPPQAEAVVFVGSDTEAPQLVALADVLSRRGRVLVQAKQSSTAARRALDLFSGAAGVVTRAPEDLAGWPARPAHVLDWADRVRAAVAGLDERDAGWVALHLASLLPIVRLGAGMRHLVERSGARVVAGALDRTVLGPLLQAVVPPGVRTVDLQHGSLMPFAVGDLATFDLVLAWSERAAQVLRADGYPEDALVEVVGNPRWDLLRSGRAACAEPLASWRQGSRVVAIFPQPAKGPFLTRSGAAAMGRWLAAWARARGDVRFLVKTRTGGEGMELGPELARLESDGQLRVVGGGDTASLGAVLACADVAVSTYSTALADAIAAGVPAVALDPHGSVGSMGLDIEELIPVADRATLSFSRLDEALAAGSPPLPDGAVMPAYDEPYLRRLQAAIAAAGI